jgi:pimeloyl-ACP methyl ester carboxylesterase
MRLTLTAIFFFVTLNASATIQGGEAIEAGGIKQWIQYSGPSEKAPVLLFIHGGPGNSVISYADKFTKQLRQHYIVVLWDQRESGKTAELNVSEQPLTVELFINDAIEVITHLQKKFSQQKIYLIGHSWGGYLGLRVAARRPDLLNGYFALSPMINQLESERLSLKAMQQKAIEENNKEAQEELAQVEIPFKNGVQLYYHRKWISKRQGSPTPTIDKVESWASTWLNLYNEACQTNFLSFAPQLDCPVYFLIGSHDFQTHFSLAEAYYQKLICPEKKFFWFTNSAHSPNMTETAKFEKTIIEVINID